MKTTIVGLVALSLAGTALALDKAELDKRIRTVTAKFDALQQKADKRIPAETLAKAKGIVLLDRTKAGFIFAFQGGSGVAMVKTEKSGAWSPVGFVKATEASLGFQIGGQQSFLVILLMNTNATRVLTEGNFQFGGEARGTAGDSSTGAEGKVVPEESVIVYDDRKGLYGGAAIQGGGFAPDEEANRIYYGEYLTMNEILFEKKGKPTELATALAEKINAQSKPAPK